MKITQIDITEELSGLILQSTLSDSNMYVYDDIINSTLPDGTRIEISFVCEVACELGREIGGDVGEYIAHEKYRDLYDYTITVHDTEGTEIDIDFFVDESKLLESFILD